MKGRGISALAVLLLMMVTVAAMAPTVQALQELKITSYNLNSLQSWGTWTSYGNGELLVWQGYPSILDVTCQKEKLVGNIRATSVDDNQCTGKYYGECVSLAKALSKSNIPTTSGDSNHWTKGDKVMTSYSITPGTVIATFFGANNGYSGHTAIFRGYVYDSSGKRIGILVWDQNMMPPYGKVVARHIIWASGSSVNNANNYYSVKVP